MIQIKPYIESTYKCECGADFLFSGLIWQGLHVCEQYTCSNCHKIRINSLPVNQSSLEQYTFYPDSGKMADIAGNAVSDNWFSAKLRSVANPVIENVEVDFEIIEKKDEVVILNTLDYVYGHSLLYLLNLQRLIRSGNKGGIIVIVQPMMKWLIPKSGISEIWTVNLSFQKFNNYYSDLSVKLNSELNRFNKVWLSKGYVLPTNENIEIELFTGIKPYSFLNEPVKRGITFIWREDPDRLWIRNIYLSKGLKKLGFRKVLIPIQYLRILLLFKYLKNKLGNEFTYSVAGLGRFGHFPSFINDARVTQFDEALEKKLCNLYADSFLVIGVHGSSMLLPSAHSGMTISLMPSKRWGNFAEDILFTEQDLRLAAFQKRIVPLNLCLLDIRDIIIDMITGRVDYIKKFLHSDEL